MIIPKNISSYQSILGGKSIKNDKNRESGENERERKKALICEN
jgi:hypothetical protein